mmetsp:Transcript_17731/g.24952  ORF Transcript_17731/g.24952 Transcript_17731/m.24952 type:complete len:666 (-) Transcript_17731:359-2356(-)
MKVSNEKSVVSLLHPCGWLPRLVLLVMLSFMTQSNVYVTALMPPHPDMPVEERRQLGQQHDLLAAAAMATNNTYIPSLIHPAMCQHISNEECQKTDEQARYHADRSLILMNSTGEINVLVLLVQFTDHAERELPSKSDILTLLMGDEIDPELTPTGSVKEWLRYNSYNKLDIRMNVMDWRLTDNTEKHYSFGVEGMHPAYSGSFEYILQQIDDEGMDWSRYDVDNDGYIDSLLILTSGYAAEMGGMDCYTGSLKSNRIWSHAIPWRQADPWTSKSGMKVGAYVTSSALRGRCGSNIARIGVIAHELIHTWGIPDLYDSSWEGKGTGVFDCMSNPYGRAGDSLNPTFLSPWSKMELGWLNPVPLEQDGDYTIAASEINPQVYIVNKGFAPREYLLIENRQPWQWDRDLWQGGILIWHIDNAVFSQRYRGHPGMENWPGNNEHYKVALLQADGEYHLETNENIGDAQDFYVQGNTLEAGPGTRRVDPKDLHLYPNTDSYQYGNIVSTGIRFFDFSPSQEFMTFSVSGLTDPDEAMTEAPSTSTETPTKSPTTSPTSNPTESPTKNPTTPSPTKSPTASPTRAPVTVPTTPAPVSTDPPTTAPIPPPTPSRPPISFRTSTSPSASPTRETLKIDPGIGQATPSSSTTTSTRSSILWTMGVGIMMLALF